MTSPPDDDRGGIATLSGAPKRSSPEDQLIPLDRPAIDPRIWARRVAVLREQGRRRLRVIAGVLAVVVLGGGGWLASRSPLLDVDRVRVVGAERTPAQEVRRVAGVRRGDPMVDVEEAAVAQRIARLPWVARVDVSKQWPSSLVITITERRPVAAVRARGGGWALVDSSGRVLAAVPLPPDDIEAIEAAPPVGAPGARLDRTAAGVLRVAAAIPRGRVNQIRVTALLPDGSIELRLVPRGFVRFGPPTRVREKLLAVLTVLDQADLRRLAVLDVRVPSAPVLTRA